MPIDRRTFMLGSSVAATVGTFASLGAVPTLAAAATPSLAAAPAFELRIRGWDLVDDLAAPASTPHGDGVRWIAIDSQWRGGWH